MKYYLGKCKFGHVGRDKYLPLNIPVNASSIKEASKIAKSFRGVKKDHKDWCLEEPLEISYERYQQEIEKLRNDIYFEKKTRSRLIQFKGRLVDEPNYSRINGIKTNRKQYKKVRDIEVVHYKMRKLNTIIESFIQEYKYNTDVTGEYNHAFTS